MKYITVEQMNNACDKEYNENYSHGGYCHEQSFRFGFQEGTEFAEKELMNKVIYYLNNCTMIREDEVEQMIYNIKQNWNIEP